MSYLKLFLLFAKIGAILLGGGYVILPIMQSEFVEKRNLLTKDELINFYALAQSLPGIVAANISMFTGYKLGGIFGALVGMFGIIFIPFLSIVILASILGVFVENIYLQGVMWGISVAVTALIILTAREVWQNSKHNLFYYLIFLLGLIGLLIFKMSPVSIIILLTAMGVLIKFLQNRRCK